MVCLLDGVEKSRSVGLMPKDKLIAALGPVSYTHLDVYKRQGGTSLVMLLCEMGVVLSVSRQSAVKRL